MISIVCSLYRSENHIREFYERTLKVVNQHHLSYEFVFVIDGCPSKSLEAALNLRKIDPRIRIVELSRNFGHHRAMMIGVEAAKGEQVYLTDVDLEEPPEILDLLLQESKKLPEADVVYGVSPKRKGSLSEKWIGSVFYKVFNFLSSVAVPTGALVSRLMKRNYVNALIQFQERELYIPGIWELTGFKQIGVTAQKISRPHASTYSFRKKIFLAFNAVTSFSDRPLWFIFFMGLVITGLSFVMGLYFLAQKLLGHIEVPGWASVIVVLFFLSGLMIFSIGTCAVYISKIFIEVKHRPYKIVRQTYESE